MSFAATTSVPVDRTKSEIEKLVARYGAYQYAIAMDEPNGAAYVGFTVGTGPKLRQVRVDLPLPKRADFASRRGRPVSATARDKAYEQACRSRWRQLLLVLKANFEAVEAGVTTVEKAFFAFIRLPDGRVLHDEVSPKLATVYETGQVPPLLGPPTS